MRRRLVRPAVLRAAGLIRVSKVGDRGDDLLSPDLQRNAITAYADARGMEIIEWVEALDESGSQSGSPWWRKLDQTVTSVEDGDLDAILVWKFSRAARHRKQWAVALDRVEAAGGVLESATEQLDTTTSTGRLARGMLAELAAWEAEVKGEQWKEVHASRLARGLPASGAPRFGYTYSRGSGYEIDPEQAPIVQAMFARFIQGDTFTRIATWMLAEGIVTRRGFPWQSAKVKGYMDSGFAAGIILANGQEHPGAHEPIITAQEWSAYRRVRETAKGQPPRVRQPVHPLGGLVKCGLCGGAACRVQQKPRADGRKRFMFTCCSRGFLPGSCRGSSMGQDRAYEAVKEFLADLADELDRKANALVAQKARAGQVRVDAGRAAREISRLDEAIARLAVQAAQGLLPPSAHALAVDDLLRQRDTAQERLRKAETDVAYLSAPAPATARTLLGSWDELAEVDPKGLRDVLAALISRVEMYPPPKGSRRSIIRVVPRWAAE